MDKLFICDGCNQYRRLEVMREHELDVKSNNTIKTKTIWLCDFCVSRLSTPCEGCPLLGSGE